MKTLDEVIKTFDGCFLKSRKEWCIENCPYLQNDEQMCRRDVLIDALHYLKEYKRISARLEKIALGNITETLEKLDNPALTWDELKQMEGKPVWVEWHDHKEWFLIDSIDKKKVVFRAQSGFEWHCIRRESETWNAYRKER